LNNETLAEKCRKASFHEFQLAADLSHPNLVDYKYFYERINPRNGETEFHVIMELMEGKDMETFLKDYGPP
jgi:serine/threonine protein kinase